MRTIIAILAVVITGCAQAHAQTPSQSQDSHRPSATEIFELQAKCAALVDKMAQYGRVAATKQNLKIFEPLFHPAKPTTTTVADVYEEVVMVDGTEYWGEMRRIS